MRHVKKQKKKKNLIPMKWKIMGVVLCLIGVGGYAFVHSSVGRNCFKAAENVYAYMRHKSGLSVNTVIVYGHARTGLDEINRQIGLARGMPIFDVDLNQVKTAIEALPWVRSVVVERFLPDTIYIKIREKEPIAIWQHQKEYWPVDEKGEIVNDHKTPVGSVLLVVGNDALEHTPDLIKTLDKYPKIREKVRSAVRVGDRRWNLILNEIDNGLTIRLPESNIDQALERIDKEDEKNDLLKRDLKVIDVCSSDRIFVQKAELK